MSLDQGDVLAFIVGQDLLRALGPAYTGEASQTFVHDARKIATILRSNILA
jgi:hypothetical protein